MQETDNSKPEQFVHLHLHTQYSPLDGAIKIDELTKRLQELDMRSCAITDHGSMYGVIDFFKQFKSAGLHPVLGSEFYISPGSRFDREYERGQDSNYHLVLLAENNIGLANLYHLSSIAFLDGFYRKPRIDKEILAKYSEGIIALSACLGGEVAKAFLKGSYTKALETALEYDKIMGRGNFYLEIQENKIPDQTILNRQLLSISKETGIPLVATCDCHYLHQTDNVSHDILMQVQFAQGANMEKRVKRIRPDVLAAQKVDEDITSFLINNEPVIIDPDNVKKAIAKEREAYSDQLYLKSYEEIARDFHYAPEAIENTVKIANRCHVTIEFDHLHLPQYEVPQGYTISTFFAQLARDGLKKRLEQNKITDTDKYWERLELEIKIIVDKSFDGYFLIVWDFINYSRSAGIPVGPGRGSGAGSLVAYSLTITDVDPIRFKLLFERFLNPERVSMPDFDIDFCVNGREKVIKYVTEKYGSERVSQIITFGTLKPRNAVRDVGRVLNVLLSDVDKLAKSIPEGPSISSFKKAFDADPSLEENFKMIPQGMEILKHAKNIEGLIRNIGMHAAGIVIADKPLVEYAPLCRGPKGEVIVQFEKGTAEKVGLIKFDFLGLLNLTILDDAVKRIKAGANPDFDLSQIPLDDTGVFELLQRGETSGVFQLESDGMEAVLKKMKPTVFEDIVAANALFRPGPMENIDEFIKRKHGEIEIKDDIPEIREVLKETYGIIVYQEQVMQIAQILAGYSLGSADILRKAMGKKDDKEMERQEAIFLYGNEGMKIKGAIAIGYDEKKAKDVFQLLRKFAAYGFNKSHSVAYALIAYQTAYLKVYYRLEYMSALISGDMNRIDDVVKYIGETIRMGIKLLPPDINKSFVDFRIESGGIRFGLGAVKSAGVAAIESFIDEREKNGEFKGIYDLASRMDYKNMNRKMLESMIKAGALDSFGKTRKQHLQVFNDCLDEGAKKAKMREKGILSLEDFMQEEEVGEDYYPDIGEMAPKDLLSLEKEVLGFFLSSHPLKDIHHIIDMIGTDIESIKGLESGSPVLISGIVKSVRPHITKIKREKMAFVVLEDLTSDIDFVVFPRTYVNYIHLLEEDNIITVKGELTISDDGKASVRADEIFELGDALERFTGGVIVHFDANIMTPPKVMQLKTVIAMHRGSLPLRVVLCKSGEYRLLMRMGKDASIKPTMEFLGKLAEIQGYKSVELLPIGERFFKTVRLEDYEEDMQESV